MSSRATPRTVTLALSALVLLILAPGAGGSRRRVVTHAARRGAAAETAQIDAVALPAVDMLLRTQLPDGSFMDPLRGRIGGSGLTRIVWVALRQASRLTGQPAQARIEAATRSLARGAELTQVLPKWPLAMVFDDHLQSYLPDPQALRLELADLGALHASGIADVCFQEPGCFNNYVLAGKLLNLELARTGLHTIDRTARLADPRLVAHTLRWMAHALPRTTSETADVHIPGLGDRTGAALSDPSTYPLAYQALCTAMLTRATYLAGAAAPAAMRRLEIDALWELLGMTAPNGEISWMGRGQDVVWSLAASFYAAVQGSVLVEGAQPGLAARLRRLAEIELRALRERLAPPGLRPRALAGVPGAAGIDFYYGPVGTSSLALVWIELAREAAALPTAPARPVRPLPSEQQNAWTSDLRGTDLLALRRGRVWLGVRTRGLGGDPRTGWGLLRALRQRDDGSWESLLPDRPVAPVGRPAPSAGPLLVAGARVSAPVTRHAVVARAGIVLRGVWQGGAGTAGAQWVWAPRGDGVQLTTSCPRHARLRFTEWLPGAGQPRRGLLWLSRGGFEVRFSAPIAVVALPGRYASARDAALTAYSVSVACAGRPLRVLWTGNQPAPA
jgi:hypothetical protein